MKIMKKQILTIGAAMLFTLGSATFIGCGNDEHHDGDHHEHAEGENHYEHAEGEEHHEEAVDHDGIESTDDHYRYQCPMKCEGDKMYEEEGSCPECGMDLKEF